MVRTILQLGLCVRLPTIRVILAFAITIAQVSCSPPKVLVEIENESSRAKYITLLDEHRFRYQVNEQGIIYVEASIDELLVVDKKFKTWEAEKYRKEGIIILE